VVVGSLRDHTAHMNSLVFQTALSSCDCSLTAVCADARLCEQLLPATATLPDLTHCPERSVMNSESTLQLQVPPGTSKWAAARVAALDPRLHGFLGWSPGSAAVFSAG
jgi:hypothetical protein